MKSHGRKSVHPEDEPEKPRVEFRKVQEKVKKQIGVKASLRKPEEPFESLMTELPVGLYRRMPGKDGRFVSANRTFLKLLGYDSVEEFLKLKAADVYVDTKDCKAFSDRFLSVDQVSGVELHLKKRDGTPVWGSFTSRVVRNARGEVEYLEGIMEDITHRKQAEEALRESERRLASLIDLMPDAAFVIDGNGVVVAWNRAIEALTGVKAEEMLGKGDHEYAIPFYGERRPILIDLVNTPEEELERGYQNLSRHDDVLIGESPLHVGGREAYLQGRARALSGAHGEYVGAIEILHDFTDLKRAEQALRESEQRLRRMIETTGEGFWMVDKDEITTAVNDAMCAILGRPREQILGRSIFEFVNADNDAIFRTQVKRRAQGEGTVYEISLTRPDGSLVPCIFHANPLLGPDGRKTASFAMVTDITERKLAEEALRESEARYRHLFENLDDIVYTHDAQGLFTSINKAGERITGYDRRELLGMNFRDILAPEYVERAANLIRAAAVERTRVGDQWEILTKDGRRVLLETSLRTTFHGQRLMGVEGIARDITERKRAEEARLEIEKMKDEFVSTVSHELRTPLTSIRGALGLLTSGVLGADPTKSRRMLEIAVANTDRLIRLINDILDIERIESGRVKLEKCSCNAASLIAQAADSVREMANRAGVNLELLPTSGSVLADADRVVQTLTNLLGNAIKFSSSGKAVTLSAKPQGDEMLFEVKDQGRGIPADKLGVIFERFQQVDASDGRAKGGTGLGLAICRSIVDQHGGRIWAESQWGKGSSFYFTLPLMEEQAETSLPAETPVPEASPEQRTVLICDDDPSIRIVVKTLLEQHDYRVLAAASGKEAIQQAAAWQPDAILLDLLMPEMDGWQTLAALRNRRETTEIPVIILSVLAPHQARKSDGEVAGWVQKPVDEALLFQTLSAALSKSPNSARVLVVEDDLDLAHVIRDVFERHGIEVFQAQTGREAIQSAERLLPNLIILDLVLPELDGFEVVAGLRNIKALRSVPLVVYTAKDIDEAERERLKLGETVFFTKGRISPEEFERRVIGLLDRLTSARPAGRLQ